MALFLSYWLEHLYYLVIGWLVCGSQSVSEKIHGKNSWEQFRGNRCLFLGINTICGKNNQLSSHNWLVKFAEDTNQQFEIRTDKITSIRTGKILVTDVESLFKKILVTHF